MNPDRMELLKRITSNPHVMVGQPCVRGLRIPVATILDSLADKMTPEEILAELPALEPPDISAALAYAACRIREEIIPLAPAT